MIEMKNDDLFFSCYVTGSSVGITLCYQQSHCQHYIPQVKAIKLDVIWLFQTCDTIATGLGII